MSEGGLLLSRFPERSFDTIVDTFGLCSHDNPVQVLREVSRVCKKDGTIILLEHGRAHYNWLNKKLDDGADKHHCEWGCRWNRDMMQIIEEYDAADLQNVLGQGGLRTLPSDAEEGTSLSAEAGCCFVLAIMIPLRSLLIRSVLRSSDISISSSSSSFAECLACSTSGRLGQSPPSSSSSSSSSSSCVSYASMRYASTSSPRSQRKPSSVLTRKAAEVEFDPMAPFPATLATGPLTVSYPNKALDDYLRDREAVVHNLMNQPQGVMLLQGQVFNVPVRVDILHRCVRYLRAKWQQGTHKTKTRSQVSGGGKKPWPQKGSGRARHGSIRSPLWKGGGRAFGPKPRSHAHGLYLNVRRMALKCALSAKANEGRLVIVDSLVPPESAPKTALMKHRLERIMSGMYAETALLVDTDKRGSDGGVMLRRAAGNLPYINVMMVDEVTVYHLLKSHALIITRPALKQIADNLAALAHPHRKPLRHAWWRKQQAAYKSAAQELLAASQ
eukprot:gene23669-9204_t